MLRDKIIEVKFKKGTWPEFDWDDNLKIDDERIDLQEMSHLWLTRGGRDYGPYYPSNTMKLTKLARNISFSIPKSN